MSAIDNQPTNPSFLSPLGFKFELKRTPHLNYFVQSIKIPGISMGSFEVDTPFKRIPLPGTRLNFDNLEVTFKVDEDLKNYLEIYNWLIAIGFPDNFDQYANISSLPAGGGDNIYSDISIFLTTSAMNPNYEILCVDCFPVDISSLPLDSTSADVEYLTATVTFALRKFVIKQVI